MSELYGFMEDDLDGAKDRLEGVLGIQFAAHDSYYRGGDYFRWGEISEGDLVLQRNIDLIDDEPAEPSFAEFKILLYLNDPPNAEEIRGTLRERGEGFVLLEQRRL